MRKEGSEMDITGEDIIERIAERLDDEGVRCYDEKILGKLRSLNSYELSQLFELGDVVRWRNDRVNRVK